MTHKIFIVDDHPMVIEGFKALLKQGNLLVTSYNNSNKKL